MSTNITIPDFDFAKFYYGEILDALIQYKRRYVPELTDETPYEPLIQLLRAFALVGHLNNTNLDLIANEAYLSSAKLVESVREHLRLIDYQLKPAVPSQVDELFELATTLLSITTVVPENALISTTETVGAPEVFFEVLEAVTSARTDELSHVHSYTDAGPVWADYTTEANAASDWTPWTDVSARDAIYFGHADALWDKLSFVSVTTPGNGIVGIWEFYGNHVYKIAPSDVTDGGTTLTFDVNSMVGVADRSDTVVRVTLNSTGAFEDRPVVFGTINEITTTVEGGTLGQSPVSTTTTDYTLSMPWYELSDVVDGTEVTGQFEQAGNVDYTLPQSLTENWQKTTVEGDDEYWVRFRVISETSTADPVLNGVQIDLGKQYVITSVIQGQTKLDAAILTSDGSPDQSVTLSRDYFILNSETVTASDEEWIPVDNFLSSKSTSKHYTVSLGENDRATINFGDGVLGFIPPTDSIIDAEYRHNAELDGNVGADTVTNDRQGLVSVSSVTNPRGASGWAASQGSTEQSLEQAKIEGPASLRIKEVALNSDDVETLAVSYVDDNGTSPFVRSKAFEGTYGPKTIELVVVAAGGGFASTTQLEDAEKYFNGDKTSTPVKPKRIVANQELSAGNYTQKTIDITATVTAGDITGQEIEDAISRILQPEALGDDGISYLWEFGEDIPVSRLNHEIFKIDDSIEKVVFSTPASPWLDIELGIRELPVAGAISITVVAS